MVALSSMLRVVGRLDNLRPAPGAQGQLAKVNRPGGHFAYMREDYGGYSVLPTSKLCSCFISSSFHLLFFIPQIDIILTELMANHYFLCYHFYSFESSL